VCNLSFKVNLDLGLVASPTSGRRVRNAALNTSYRNAGALSFCYAANLEYYRFWCLVLKKVSELVLFCVLQSGTSYIYWPGNRVLSLKLSVTSGSYKGSCAVLCIYFLLETLTLAYIIFIELMAVVFR